MRCRGGRGERQPLWFHAREGGHLAFAGLAAGDGDLAFVILTTTANSLVAPYHDRMPVLLSPEGIDAWLARGDSSVLAAAPEGWLAMREASQRVNLVANDGPELLDPPTLTAQMKLDL